ncbi:MAG: hypothetical protein HC875_29600 [Anaerolineales bacterium]|nr:hypothetical protein [Anaerolineales bacterium]
MDLPVPPRNEWIDRYDFGHDLPLNNHQHPTVGYEIITTNIGKRLQGRFCSGEFGRGPNDIAEQTNRLNHYTIQVANNRKGFQQSDGNAVNTKNRPFLEIRLDAVVLRAGLAHKTAARG